MGLDSETNITGEEVVNHYKTQLNDALIESWKGCQPNYSFHPTASHQAQAWEDAGCLRHTLRFASISSTVE